MVYAGVARDTDLRYTVTRSGVKEELVLRSESAPTSFTFHLSDPGQQLGHAHPQAGGAVTFDAMVDGDVQVGLAAPAAYELTQGGRPGLSAPGSARQSVVPAGDGFDVTESVDPSWLKGHNFPVVLDPTVTLVEPGGLYLSDVVRGANCSTTDPGGCTPITGPNSGSSMDIGTYTDAYNDIEPSRGLIGLALSGIPVGSKVSSATFSGYVMGCTGYYIGQPAGSYLCSQHNYTLGLHALTAQINQYMTYDQINAVTSTSNFTSIYQPAFSPCPSTGCFYETFDITSKVQSWVSGSPNYGFAVEIEPEAYNVGGPAWSWDSTPNSPQPTAKVTYDPAPGPPGNVTAKPGWGSGAATASWSLASAHGGSAITTYAVAAFQNGSYTGHYSTVCGTCTSGTVTGLTNGATYTLGVYAINADGIDGPIVQSGPVVPTALPILSKSVADENGNALSASAIRVPGQLVTYKLTVQNPQNAPLKLNSLTDQSPAGLALTAQSVLLNGSPLVTTAGCVIGTGSCQVSGNVISMSGVTMPALATWTLVYSAVVTGSSSGCQAVSNQAMAAVDSGYATSAVVSFAACDQGLGTEPWWTYRGVALGPQQTGQVNVANGNLVVTATDSTEVTGHGRLGFVIRRTYNSQDTGVLSLPGSWGAGWQLNVAAADGLADGGLTPVGLVVPATTSVLNPAAVTLIDRDGSRHTFTLSSLQLNTPVLDVTSPTGLTAAIGPLMLSLDSSNYNHLCADMVYQAPPGVHLGLWRYIEVNSSASNACGDLSNTSHPPVVLGYEAVRPDGLRMEFSSTGALLDLKDRTGVSLVYRYQNLPLAGTAVGNVTQIFQADCDPSLNSHCKAVSFGYPSATESDVTDPAGRVTKYLFDSATPKHLVQVVNPDGSSTSYSYAPGGSGSCSPTVGQMCSVTDERGHSTSFHYVASAAGVATAAPALVSSFTDRRGTTTTLGYTDTSGQVSATSATAGSQVTGYSSIDSAGRVAEIQQRDTGGSVYTDTHQTWDTASAPCQAAGDVVDNNLCRVVVTAFNDTETGQSNGITTPDRDTRYTYNPEGQPLTVTAAVGDGTTRVTSYGYSAQYVQSQNGTTARSTVVTDTVAGSGTVDSQSRPAAGSTLFALSDRTQALTPRGNAAGANYTTYLTSYYVDDNPAVAPDVDPGGDICAQPDLHAPAFNTGLVCEVDAPSVDGTNPTVTRYSYDHYGQKTSMITPKAISETAAGQSPAAYHYVYFEDGTNDLSGHTDAGGWLRAVVDPTGSFVAFGYDAAGNPVRTWDRDATAGHQVSDFPGTATAPPNSRYSEADYGTGTTAFSSPWRYLRTSIDPLGNTTSYTVDGNGNRTTIRPPRGNQADNANFDITQSFDNGDLLSTVQQPVEVTSGKHTSYGYDASGNRTMVTDPDGDITVTQYDAANRPTATLFTRGAWPSDASTVPPACRESTTADAPIPAGRILCSTTTAYDGLGDQVSTQDANHQTTRSTFDALGERTSRTIPRNDGTLASTTTGSRYDADGNITTACNPRQYTDSTAHACTATPDFGSVTTYNAADKPTAVTVTRASQSRSTVTSTTSYDADGNPASATDPNGHTTYYRYDLLDRKQTITVPRGAVVSETTAWRYDPAGNVTAIIAPDTLDTGSGGSGALVVDGATAAASSDGLAHPQSNPYLIPSGAGYTTVTLQNGGWASVAGYNGGNGGLLSFTATGAVSICAGCGLTAAGRGPAGGAGGTRLATGTAGSGVGPGGANTNTLLQGGGGGAGHATVGAGGGGNNPGVGGASYGDLSTSPSGTALLGSGGGGGGGGVNAGGAGGAGGGAVRIVAGQIDDEGTISADGAPGAYSSGGGGGGGSGGTVWLTAQSIILGGARPISVFGASGGGSSGNAPGGTGATGRVRLDSASLTGTAAVPGGQLLLTTIGRVTAYGYDADNRLTQTVTGADNVTAANAGTATGGANIRTVLIYDADGHPVATEPPNSFATSVTTPNLGYLVRTDYDADGRPTANYRPRTNTSTASDPAVTGATAQTSQCPTSTRPASLTGVPGYPSDVGVCATKASYDPAGRLIQLRLPTSNGTDNRYLGYSYTDDGLLAAEDVPSPTTANARVNAASYRYDADGAEVAVTDALGDTDTTTYNADATISQTATQAYTTSTGTLISHITGYHYDADGNRTSTTDPAGATTRTSYSNDGLTLSVTDPLGDLTSYSYDNSGNPTAVTSPSANAADTNNTAKAPTVNTYSYDNLLLTSSVPLATDASTRRQTSYRYDPAGRKASETFTETNSAGATLTGGDSASTDTFSYLPDDRIATAAGHDATTISYGYDPSGAVTSLNQSGPGGTSSLTTTRYLDGLLRSIDDGTRLSRYAYDGVGQQITDADYTSGSAPTFQALTNTYYNDDERTGEVVGPTYSSSLVYYYGYDDAGRLTARVGPNGSEITRTYNPDDTLAGQNLFPYKSSTTQGVWTYNYDNDARLTSAALSGSAAGTATGSYTYGYDAAGRLNSFNDGATTNTVAYNHDGDRLGYGPGVTSSGACTPGAQTVCYDYNAADQITAQHSTVNGTVVSSPFTYQVQFGDLTRDACTAYAYDGFDRLTEAAGQTGTGCLTNPATTTYTHDGADRLTTATTTGGPTPGTDTLHYDGLTARVNDEQPATGSEIFYQLDVQHGVPLGATQAGTTSQLADDGNGNTIAVTDPSDALSCTLRYDPYGNPTKPVSATDPCNTGSTTDSLLYTGSHRDPATGGYQYGGRTYNPATATYLSPDQAVQGTPTQDLSIGTDPLTRNTYSYVNGDPLNFNDPTGHAACNVRNPGEDLCATDTPAARQAQENYYIQRHFIPDYDLVPAREGAPSYAVNLSFTFRTDLQDIYTPPPGESNCQRYGRWAFFQHACTGFENLGLGLLQNVKMEAQTADDAGVFLDAVGSGNWHGASAAINRITHRTLDELESTGEGLYATAKLAYDLTPENVILDTIHNGPHAAIEHFAAHAGDATPAIAAILVTHTVAGLAASSTEITAETLATEEGSLTTQAAAEDLPAMTIDDAQFGAKVGKHAGDYGLNPADPAARDYLRNLITDIRGNADEVRIGPWNPKGGGGDAYLFFRQGSDVVVTQPDGSFVTILKGGENNGWFQGATPR